MDVSGTSASASLKVLHLEGESESSSSSSVSAIECVVVSYLLPTDVCFKNTESEASTSESLGSRNSAKWGRGANVFKSLLQKLRQKPSGLWEKVDGGNLCFEYVD